MCGINGIFSFNGIKKEKLHDMVKLMNEKIFYRGPDSEGFFVYENICMGMRRLSIIDLVTGEQPIYNEDKSIAVVFNGEIYNFIELKNQLVNKGHSFYTNTDTEVIVHLYEECGEKCFKMLDGMFAISIYDIKKNKLVLARDRMGEKPLYYFKNNNYFVWGSELKSIIGTNLVEKKINKKALNQYLQLTYIPAPLSIFDEIYKLEPGSFLEIRNNGCVRKEKYWELELSENKELSYRNAMEKVYDLVEKSVQSRLVSDVKVGAFLSGGIDSGSVVGIMSKYCKEPIETFTIGFDIPEYDERKRAKKIAEFNHTNHHEYILHFDDAIKLVEEIIEKLDEPFSDPSILATYFVSKCASSKVKVILTGDGGDEVFAGYNKYLIRYYSRIYLKIPKVIRKNLIESIVYKMPDTNNLTRKIRKVITNADMPAYDQMRELMCMGFKNAEMDKLLKKDYMVKEDLDFIKDAYNKYCNNSDMIKIQNVDMKIVLEGDMLAKVDRMSMLNSLETRAPLLANDVVQFAASLPAEYKIYGKKLKKVFKDSMKRVLPVNFDKGPKTGFGVPVDYWLRNELKNEMEKLLFRDRVKKQGIFNYEYIEQIKKEHLSGTVNRKRELWSLIIFQKWYDKYFCGE